MKIEVLWNEMLWWLVNTDILGECTACFFSILGVYINEHVNL